jgi:hypothetical protein
MASSTSPPQRNLGPGLAGALSLMAFLTLPLLPVVGAFVAVLAPLPLLNLVANGRPAMLGWGWVAVILVAGALVSRSPLLVAVAAGYLLLAAWPAVSVETWLRRRWTTGRWAAVVTLVALAVAVGLLTGVFYPSLPAEALTGVLERATVGSAELLRGLGSGAAGTGAEEMLHWAIAVTAYLAPAGVALYLLSAVLWLRPRLALFGVQQGTEPFELFASEEWLPVGFALGGLGWVFLPEPGKWLSANLLVTVLGLYFVHGVAIILYYIGRRIGMNRWVRAGVVLLTLQMPVPLICSALGLADTFFRLRRGGAKDGESDA